MGNVHQFIGHCLIPLDPCLYDPNLEMELLADFQVTLKHTHTKKEQFLKDNQNFVFLMFLFTQMASPLVSSFFALESGDR